MGTAGHLLHGFVTGLVFWMLASSTVHAKCSRIIQVPVAPIGQSVVIEGESISGIYPELLRGLSDKEGCSFTFTEVPRARLELMFEAGRADLLIPASKTPKRDAFGTFVPLVQNRATLISLSSNRVAIRSMQELQDDPSIKVALVRGFDYGPSYQELMSSLAKKGRLIMDVDALSVARLLKSGTAHATIMAPTIFAGAIQDDDRVKDLIDRLRIEPLDELPWGFSGVYLSNNSLNSQDRAALQDAFERASRSGEIWKGFLKYYSPTFLRGGIRPL
jgi:polar amino acid transport system substrate-binding protein